MHANEWCSQSIIREAESRHGPRLLISGLAKPLGNRIKGKKVSDGAESIVLCSPPCQLLIVTINNTIGKKTEAKKYKKTTVHLLPHRLIILLMRRCGLGSRCKKRKESGGSIPFPHTQYLDFGSFLIHAATTFLYHSSRRTDVYNYYLIPPFNTLAINAWNEKTIV